MAQEPLENLDTTVIRKRRRFASILLWVLVVVALANGLTALVKPSFTMIVMVPALLLCALPMWVQIKRFDAELARRETKLRM
jgi:hypothetical protein